MVYCNLLFWYFYKYNITRCTYPITLTAVWTHFVEGWSIAIGAVHHFLTRQPFNLKVESHHVIIRFPEICSLAFRTPFLWIPMFFHTLMGNVLVHLSISFCFQYGVLKDTSQRLNFNELARVTKKYSLSVRVTGAADSSTGTSGINDSLNISRACLVATELEWHGISAERIIRIS